MFRPCSAVLLLLGIASPGVTQTSGSADWVLASGEFAIYGHTIYTPTFILVPRIVYDTAHRLDSARVVDSVRAAARSGGGFAAGLDRWPTDSYCGGPASAAMETLDPRWALARVQLAARCDVRLVIVPPRRTLTADGRTAGVFSVDSARRVTDRYAAVLPPDTLRKYRATILGLNLADDYTCTTCWGGKAITRAQIAEWAAYARAKLPGLPLGVRVTPDWAAAYAPLPPLLDYAWAQYHTKKGDPKAYYDGAAALAGRLGLELVMGVNVEDCAGVGTDPCSPEELVRLGTLAMSHPGSCAFVNWRYDAATWERPEIRAAWDSLLGLARARPGVECRRVG